MITKLPVDESEIYAGIGYAHTKWAEVEDLLCHIFSEAVAGGHSPPADAAFWDVNSFIVRLDMTSAALETRLNDKSLCGPDEAYAKGLLAQWAKTSKRVREQNSSRNKLAHGSALRLDGIISYMPYYYSVIRGEALYIYQPEFNRRTAVTSKIPRGLTKHNIFSIARGFQAGAERLRLFLVALKAHNKAQSVQLEERMRFFAEAQEEAARTLKGNQQPPPPSQEKPK